MALIPAPIARAWNAMRARPENPESRPQLMIVGANNAKVRVTPEVALGVSAIWACIDCIASAMSSSDWNVYSGNRGMNDQQFLPGDGLQWVLNTRFNPEMTAQSGKRALMISALAAGNGYAEIVRDMAGRIVELWPIAWDRALLKRRLDSGELYLQVHNDYGDIIAELPMRDVFHIRGPGLTGILGDNTFARAVQTIAMSVALDQFAAAYFANGAQMGVVLEYPGLGKMDDATYTRLKDSWNERHGGGARAFRTGFIDGGMKLHQITVEAEKAQMIDARNQQIEECCRWFRVPPHKIGHLLRSTNNNIEHQGLEFSRDTLRPWKVEIEQEADYKLVPARGAKRFICIDTDWAAEGDFKSRMEGFQIGRNMGVYSANDILRKLGENTISKADGGDLRIVNGAAIPLQRVGENYPNGGNPPVQTGAPGDEPAPDDEDEDGQQSDELLEDWARGIFNRIAARVANRLQDLERQQHPDAEKRARQDGLAYAEKVLQEIQPALDRRWPGSDGRVQAMAARVVFGFDAGSAASELFQSLKGKP